MSNSQETILVTGASGFTGRHLIAQIAKELSSDSRVITTSRRQPHPRLPKLGYHHQIDITDRRMVEQLIADAQPTRIFHLAGTFRGTPDQIYRTNFQATLNLLTAVRLHAPESRVLCIGSAAEYGLPLEPTKPICEETTCAPAGDYATSKYCQTRLALNFANTHNLKIVIARPFNLVGPGTPSSLLVGAVINRLQAALAEPASSSITTGNLMTARDFLDIRDAVRAYLCLLETACWGQIFNVCSGQATRVKDVVQILLSFCPQQLQIISDPSLIRHNDPPCVFGNIEKLKTHTSFLPRYRLQNSLRDAWLDAKEPTLACGSLS